MEEIYITDDTITLGQFLKLTNLFDSGGFIKHYLKDEGVYINDEIEHRRGRKLSPNDIVKVDDTNTFIVRVQT